MSHVNNKAIPVMYMLLLTDKP